MNFTEKRARVIDRHKLLVEENEHWAKEKKAGRDISARPVAFHLDNEIVVVGPCVGVIFDGLRKFAGMLDPIYHERAAREPSLHRAIKVTEKALAGPMPEEIRVDMATWNGYVCALGEAGVQVVMTDGLKE